MSTVCVAVGLCIILASLAVGIAVTIVNSDSIDKGIQKAMNPDRDYLILVNDKNQYEFGGKYDKALQNKSRGVVRDQQVGFTWVF